MIIDGTRGGGQILRSSLTISLMLDLPLEIQDIRAKRSKPGLMRQHLTCVKAAAAISGAETTGCELGSSRLTFKPAHKARGGQYQFAIGTAGSTSLILQTVLVPLLFAGQSSELILEGGTHNGLSPSADFLQVAFLPLLARIGHKADLDIEQHGFYPSGGGRVKLHVEPTLLDGGGLALELEDSDLDELALFVTALNLPAHVVKRETDYCQKALGGRLDSAEVLQPKRNGAGNVVSLRAKSGQYRNVFEAYGRRGIRAEAVAKEAVDDFLHWHKAGVAVEERLVDQLLLPMLFAGGGSFTTTEPSAHLTSSIDLIRQMTGCVVTTEQISEFGYLVKVPKL